MQLISEIGRYEPKLSFGLLFLWIMMTLESFQLEGMRPISSVALKILFMFSKIFGGQSFNILNVILSIPGAPDVLHECRALFISSAEILGCGGVGVEGAVTGGSGSICIGVGCSTIEFR